MTGEDLGAAEVRTPAETWDFRGFTADGWCGEKATLSEHEFAVIDATPGFEPLWESDRARQAAFDHFSLLCPLWPGHDGPHGTYLGDRRWYSRDFWSPDGLDAFDTSSRDWYLIWGPGEADRRVLGPMPSCIERRLATTDDLRAAEQRFGSTAGDVIDGEWCCSLWGNHTGDCKFRFVEILGLDFGEWEEIEDQESAVDEPSAEYANWLEMQEQECLDHYLAGDASEWELADGYYLSFEKFRDLLAARTTIGARQDARRLRGSKIRTQQSAMQHLWATQLEALGLQPVSPDDAVADVAEPDERQLRSSEGEETPELLPAAGPPPDAVVMIQQRWQGWTLDVIGKNFGLSRERIRQILAKHGGPTAEQVRSRRASEALIAQRAREAAVATDVRAAVRSRGPMTVAEVAEMTGIDASDVSKFWPQDVSHLRLHTTGTYESRWSDEAILDAIRNAALYEFPLTTNAYAELLSQGQIKGPSMPRIWQRFGSWTSACEAAGVVAGQTMRRHYESRWSDDDLLRIVRRYLLDPEAPTSATRFDEWKRACAPDGPSFQTLRNRFGSWTEAKRRALAQEGGVK